MRPKRDSREDTSSTRDVLSVKCATRCSTAQLPLSTRASFIANNATAVNMGPKGTVLGEAQGPSVWTLDPSLETRKVKCRINQQQQVEVEVLAQGRNVLDAGKPFMMRKERLDRLSLGTSLASDASNAAKLWIPPIKMITKEKSIVKTVMARTLVRVVMDSGRVPVPLALTRQKRPNLLPNIRNRRENLLRVTPLLVLSPQNLGPLTKHPPF